MKRAPELHGLSDDHHHGLVLARKSKRAAATDQDASIRAMWAEVEARFRIDLEPHFRIEETALAPPLERRGEAGLVRRLREEHAVLRGLVAPGAGRSSADLRRFGELLERHIRFEERELFPAAQETLSAEELNAVVEASGDRAKKPPGTVR